MRAEASSIPDIVVFEPQVFGDARGYFFESYNQARLGDAIGRDVRFVQDNQSGSARGVLRGLHYQIRQPQAKLVRVLSGEIFDVAVDIRRSSPHFGHWVGIMLSAENRRQLWIPEGFAHGFCVLSDFAEVLYKASDFYAPEHERCIRWDDPRLAIDWPLDGAPLVSEKDRQGAEFGAAEVFP
ncbi:MAG: dTDP-4-dehydrorhamnose 3,5-epimerase [Gammaproteobacteria bacterium]